MQYLSINQVTDILRVAFKENRAHHLMLLLTWTHGLRRAETAAIKLKDVDGGFIRVARLKNSLPTVHPLRETSNLLFNERLALNAWLQERPKNSDALFPSRKGHGCLEPESVGRIATYYMTRANIPEPLRHMHALKHSCCALQARAGAKIENIAEYVGHKDIKNTRIYLSVSQDEAAASAFTAFNSILS